MKIDHWRSWGALLKVRFLSFWCLLKDTSHFIILSFLYSLVKRLTNSTYYVSSVYCVLRHSVGEGNGTPNSSTVAWKIPRTEEPGGLQSMGSLRVGHDWATSLSLFTFMHWRRKWQPTPVFLPGESQGRGSLVGCHLWGRTELDATEAT